MHFDTRIIQKENEKVEKYQDLKREIKRLGKLKTVSIVPIVIDALGKIRHRFQDWLSKGKIECPVAQGLCAWNCKGSEKGGGNLWLQGVA